MGGGRQQPHGRLAEADAQDAGCVARAVIHNRQPRAAVERWGRPNRCGFRSLFALLLAGLRAPWCGPIRAGHLPAPHPCFICLLRSAVCAWHRWRLLEGRVG